MKRSVSGAEKGAGLAEKAGEQSGTISESREKIKTREAEREARGRGAGTER